MRDSDRNVEHAVARILAESDRPVEVYEGVLQAIGATLGWSIGAVWELDRRTWRLHRVQEWHAVAGFEEFLALGETLALAPGEGLPGRVLATGEPAWLRDVPEDRNFPRAAAARHGGLHAGLGFPLRSPRGVVGVMEFFSAELLEPDEPLLATLDALGSLVGQFVERRRAEEEVRSSESRLRAMLEAALDAVVVMDDEGRVLGWNPAAEAIFGYTAEEAAGHDMAELIVPPSLRPRHRHGLERFRETERPVVLDRRLELTGMRRDGSEFPVELTITRIAVPGPPMFTGYLRDITERTTAVRELQASRARLVEVADAERKRIQRNLHDGAQQRLTAVLLQLARARAVEEGPDDALLGAAIDELSAGLDEIRSIAQGLHPAMLAERGLAAALEALAMRTPLAVTIDALPGRPLPEPVEAAAYYVVAEALANVTKHAGACEVRVRAELDGDTLVVAVEDDGVGGADEAGSGLHGLADRVEALGGRLRLESPDGGGTRLRAVIPA
jgi:PAS domain S-box-containing protein